MKKRIVLFAFLLWSSFSFAETVIKLNDASLIKDFVSLSFDPSGNGNIIISYSDGSVVSVANTNELQVLPNGSSTTSIIENLQSLQYARISKLVDDELVVEGTNAGDNIRIFNANGVLMNKCKASGESTLVNISNCKAGTYILCVGQNVIKFIKK